MRNIAAWLCLTLLASGVAWGAPNAARPAPLDEIQVSVDDGGHGGGLGGAGESWTLRANDTADHQQTFSAADQTDGATDSITTGSLEGGTFAHLRDYLNWTHLFDLKVPNADQEGNRLIISLTHSRKTKTIAILDDVPSSSPASVASWTTLTLVRALTSKVAWKSAAQFKAGTGIAALFQIDDALNNAAGAPPEAAASFPTPVFSVLNAAGKEVAQLRKNTPEQRDAFRHLAPQYDESWVTEKNVDSYFTLVPGTYRLAFKTLDTTSNDPAPQGFAWRAINQTVQVKPGKFSFVVIRLEKNATR